MPGRHGRRGHDRAPGERRWYIQTLKEAGYRVTSQRRTIIDVLLAHRGEHLNARELMDHIAGEDPGVGFATVYRTLEILVETNLLHQINLEEGFARYEVPDDRMHIHLFCCRCGRVIHLPEDGDKEQTLAAWAEGTGFSLLPQTLELQGLCEDCRREAAAPGRRRRRGRCGNRIVENEP